MTQDIADINRKIDDFIKLLEARTIKPIEDMGIKESCTATFLLLCAAIDSLSKMTCDQKQYDSSRKNHGVGERFTGFLKNIMHGEYSQRYERIYNLRNDVVHTGIGKKVIFSKTDQSRRKHLQENSGVLLFNTAQFFDDVKQAFEHVKTDIQNKREFYNNARDRLAEFSMIEEDNKSGSDTTAEPSPGADETYRLKNRRA